MLRGRYGLLIGLVIAGISFFISGNTPVVTLHNTSQFWMYWYGFWNLIIACILVLSTLGFIAGGTVAGGAASGLLGGLLGSVAGAGGSLLMWIPFLARCVLLIGGPYLMWTASNPISNYGFQTTQAAMGGTLFLIGLWATRRMSSSSS